MKLLKIYIGGLMQNSLKVYLISLKEDIQKKKRKTKNKI